LEVSGKHPPVEEGFRKVQNEECGGVFAEMKRGKYKAKALLKSKRGGKRGGSSERELCFVEH